MAKALFGLKEYTLAPDIEEALTNPIRRSRLTNHDQESTKTSDYEMTLKAKYPVPGNIKPHARSPANR